jgi:hypothetical protein
MPQTGVFQKLTGAQFVAFRNQHATWQNAERAFQDAHILIENQRAYASTFKECDNRRDQYCIVCTNEFAHLYLAQIYEWRIWAEGVFGARACYTYLLHLCPFRPLAFVALI